MTLRRFREDYGWLCEEVFCFLTLLYCFGVGLWIYSTWRPV